MSFIVFDRFDLFKYRVDLWSRSSVPARAKTVSDARIYASGRHHLCRDHFGGGRGGRYAEALKYRQIEPHLSACPLYGAAA
jgi:hypothetical protein